MEVTNEKIEKQNEKVAKLQRDLAREQEKLKAEIKKEKDRRRREEEAYLRDLGRVLDVFLKDAFGEIYKDSRNAETAESLLKKIAGVVPADGDKDIEGNGYGESKEAV